MNSELRWVQAALWGFLGLVVLAVIGIYFATFWAHQSPVLPVYGEVPGFTLTNQFGAQVSLSDLKGKVWVADIIFTRCPGPCLQMTRRMKAIQEGLAGQPGVELVSLTADPTFDTPSVLNQYAARYKADSKDWLFLTGPKQAVYGLALRGLKLAVEENPNGKIDEDQFIHSTRLIVVDREGQLRGVGFDGTEPQSVKEVLRSVHALLNER